MPSGGLAPRRIARGGQLLVWEGGADMGLGNEESSQKCVHGREPDFRGRPGSRDE